MSYTLIKSLYRQTEKYLHQPITVAGWVRTARSAKEFAFIELNDGTLNLKFLLDDINLVLPTINDYVAPKDRTIKANDECKLVNNKITPVQKGSTVKVLKMFNRHQVHNPRLGVYDKNTVALVLDKTSNKQFECKIKQLKKI